MSLKRSIPSPPTQMQSSGAQIDIPIQGILSRDDRNWKHLLSSDPSSTTSILHFPGDDISVPTMGFLYDYYGITEETQHGPPSPGTRYLKLKFGNLTSFLDRVLHLYSRDMLLLLIIKSLSINNGDLLNLYLSLKYHIFDIFMILMATTQFDSLKIILTFT